MYTPQISGWRIGQGRPRKNICQNLNARERDEEISKTLCLNKSRHFSEFVTFQRGQEVVCKAQFGDVANRQMEVLDV